MSHRIWRLFRKPPERLLAPSDFLAARPGLRRPVPVVPRVLHYVYLVAPDGPGYPFNWLKYMALVSVLRHLAPETIVLHTNLLPDGFWWEQALEQLQANDTALEVVNYTWEQTGSVFGQPIKRIQHRTDVIRMRALIKRGGVYLDWDSILVNPVEPLLYYDCSITAESQLGVGNGIIFAKPGAGFLRRWWRRYRQFDADSWDYNSLYVPTELALRAKRSELNLMPQRAFLYPDFSGEGLTEIYTALTPELWDHSYAMHLWESGAPYFLNPYIEDPGLIYQPPTTNFKLVARSLISKEFLDRAAGATAERR